MHAEDPQSPPTDHLGVLPAMVCDTICFLFVICLSAVLKSEQPLVKPMASWPRGIASDRTPLSDRTREASAWVGGRGRQRGVTVGIRGSGPTKKGPRKAPALRRQRAGGAARVSAEKPQTWFGVALGYN